MEYNTTEKVIVEEENYLCRVCLSSNQNSQCIFRANQNDPNNSDTLDLCAKIWLCSGVEILEDDGLPTNICTKCIFRVNAAHELRELCQKSDAKLRELYGIGSRDRNNEHINVDQCCQTDHTLTCSFVKIEEYVLPPRDQIVVNQKAGVVSEDVGNFDERQNNKDNDQESINDVCAKQEQVEQEVPIAKKEACRTRRLTVFKRVTSMENLKNHKERQRQHIKKNINSKRDFIEKDKSLAKSTDKICATSQSVLTHHCPICDRSYSSKRTLDKHSLLHDDKKFKCEKCGEYFFDLDKLSEHSKSHKAKQKSSQVTCKICHKNFRKTDTMVRHLNVHKRTNPKEVFSVLKEIRDKRKLENDVPVNNEYSRQKIYMKEELILSHDINGLVTDSRQCEMETDLKVFSTQSFNSDSNSDSIYDSSDNGLFHRCDQCTKCYSTERSLQRHLLVHSEKKFVCNVCNMKFFRQDRLKSHRDRYGHDEGKLCIEPQKPPDDKSAIKLINSWIREELDSDNEGKGFPCKICGKSYDTKKSLLKHQINAHDVQREDCEICEKECTCTNKHKDREMDAEKKPYTCDECDKSFEKEIKLQRHARVHKRAKEQQDTNFKRFLCHICSKTFRQNTGLMFHMRTHTGYKPHVCKYCGRGFTSNSNCINHERTHTGDRPFVCHFCSAAFAKSCTLKAHITTHTGEANYHCKTCGKSFRRLKYLKEHRFTHTGEKPYACKICGTAYSHSGSLFVHEKKCKAQYGNYQQNAQTYCQNQAVTLSSGSVTTPATTITATPTPAVVHTTAPIIPPIIASVPHLSGVNSGTNSIQGNKNYMDGVQRMNVHAGNLHAHPNTDIGDVASAVRNFAIIGQMFHS